MQHKLNSVKEFHTAFGIGYSETMLGDLGENKNLLRYNLMKEENEEYLEAAQNNDIVEIADALGDMLYILCIGSSCKECRGILIGLDPLPDLADRVGTCRPGKREAGVLGEEPVGGGVERFELGIAGKGAIRAPAVVGGDGEMCDRFGRVVTRRDRDLECIRLSEKLGEEARRQV